MGGSLILGVETSTGVEALVTPGRSAAAPGRTAWVKGDDVSEGG